MKFYVVSAQKHNISGSIFFCRKDGTLTTDIPDKRVLEYIFISMTPAKTFARTIFKTIDDIYQTFVDMYEIDSLDIIVSELICKKK
jgi:hypothetical protein